LESWLEEKYSTDRQSFDMLVLDRCSKAVCLENNKVRVVDLWGHSIRFECPALDPKAVFVLYSIGKNGKDEKGRGDDIVVTLEYEQVRAYFADPSFDGSTYRRYEGRLKCTRIANRSMIVHP